MYANSRQVESSQVAPHPRLREIVRRHRLHGWQRPSSRHGLLAAAQVLGWLASTPQKTLLLDSGCGTGASSLALAQACPDALVLGVDRSLHRLGRGSRAGAHVQNLMLVRADVEDLWPALVTAGIRPSRHCLWYPNPWPKPGQLKRRWHGHPVFPELLKLGGQLELRSNWRVYIEEFAVALEEFEIPCQIHPLDPAAASVSPFERKYRDSGHPLWCLRARLGAGGQERPG